MTRRGVGGGGRRSRPGIVVGRPGVDVVVRARGPADVHPEGVAIVVGGGAVHGRDPQLVESGRGGEGRARVQGHERHVGGRRRHAGQAVLGDALRVADGDGLEQPPGGVEELIGKEGFGPVPLDVVPRSVGARVEHPHVEGGARDLDEEPHLVGGVAGPVHVVDAGQDQVPRGIEGGGGAPDAGGNVDPGAHLAGRADLGGHPEDSRLPRGTDQPPQPGPEGPRAKIRDPAALRAPSRDIITL